MVSARPVATWLTASPSVISAKTSDISVPATMPNSAPMKIEPVSHAPRKAAGRADDHHALDAEIEHAGALGHELAGRRDQQRRRGGEHREDDGFNQFHGPPVGVGKTSLKR